MERAANTTREDRALIAGIVKRALQKLEPAIAGILKRALEKLESAGD